MVDFNRLDAQLEKLSVERLGGVDGMYQPVSGPPTKATFIINKEVEVLNEQGTQTEIVTLVEVPRSIVGKVSKNDTFIAPGKRLVVFRVLSDDGVDVKAVVHD